MLASFYSSNELANAILFAAFACFGIRVFIPIYPETDEFENWYRLTNFKCVIIPYKKILQQKGHDREKEVILSFASLCQQKHIAFLDAYEDFGIPAMLQHLKEKSPDLLPDVNFTSNISTEAEAVIFTTSGTSGKSKLVVYNQGSFSRSCQSWQEAGMFDPELCGNPGFTPLFTHTIGIRNFINALWTGNPVCIIVVDWFLNKPEEARYLLLRMKPGHIVGGPALFNMLNEFFRQFPELKISLRKNLKTLISIGAPYNLSTARQIKSALGLELINAFGTTETQMVLLNKPKKNSVFDHESLGQPLPGVLIGLKETEDKGVYELYIKSPYQSSRVINESSSDPYFSTGDLVTYNEAEGRLLFAARKGTDFIKDEFGVKIPLNILKEYYSWLCKISTHIEWILLDNKPGLGALIFLAPSCYDYPAKEISEWLKSRNETLQSAIQPFEFTHRHLERFSIVKAEPPLTRKGTVSRKNLLTQFEEIIHNLQNPFVSEQRIESVDTEEKSLLYKFSNPRMATLLEALKIDVRFEKGERDFLYFQKNGKQKKVLDLVGGFGSGLLGHDHPDVKKAMKNFLDSSQPALNSQGSQYYYPSILARELNKLFSKSTGKFFKVQFANTGSEAMEIALHHAYFEWWTWIEKLRDEQLQLYGSLNEIDVADLWEQNIKKAAEAPAAFIVINNCFHGYSSGARSLLNNKKQRTNFSGLLGTVPLHVDDRNKNWKGEIERYIQNQCIVLKTIIKEEGRYIVKPEKVSNIIASVIEPVRGEGGIYETKIEVADFLAQQKFPLIADEIQCGLGRTGSLPSYPNASYYLLGKSLGGGYEKIAAVLIDDDHFKTSFPQYYTSTFANGELAACAALAVLEVIDKENITATSLKKGNKFIKKLKKVADNYPDIIESVQGKGLMLGVHFNKEIGKRNILLRVLCENELLGYLIAGWMFHNKRIRVLPSLSKPDSIRLEPSVYLSDESMDQFCDALNDLCYHSRNGNMYELLKYLMNDDPYLDRYEKSSQGNFPVTLEEPAPGALEVGFIGNFTIPPKELVLIEPDLKKASDTGLRILFNKMQSLLEGKSIRLFSKNLMNGKIHFTFYILPFDTAHLELINRWGKKRYYIARIQETINKLTQEGISHISLGAHTSILSGNGLYLAESKKVKILTGNTLTVASCLYHLEQYLEEHRREISRPVTIAITGANGNIGSGLAGCLDDEKYNNAKILLVGNNLKKLELLRKKIFAPNRCVDCSIDLFHLQEADLIISCTNTNDPLIFSYHIHPGHKVFIIDIAVPGSVSDDVKQMKNVQFCKEASTVYMPDEPDFLISTHTPVGKVFCCAAEVMLAALYDVQLPLKGHVNPDSIKKMMKLAIKEGLFNKKEYAPSV
jgi:acetylornithine/succinyldiaminopimelate/putrescine aminotransferase/predicted amino acid dehydrogenase